MFDFEEFDRWFRSARLTLESAKRDLEAGDYCWACFKAHQAAEKALKAILWGLGIPRAGHMLNKLLNILRSIGIEVPIEVEHACNLLNKYYIPTRYPDAWSEGIPEEYFTREDAENAIKSAELVLSWVDSVWRRLLRRD
ncbi:MAG: HEPN domain-containing protein [Crenarchaeota archaeon]|nr:HEPN domain-containing protein [Thermoproteota archaeon]